MGAAAFWRQNRAELLQIFSPPAAFTQLEAHVHEFEAVCSLGDSLTCIQAQPEGSIVAVLKDWASCETFLCEYEAFTSADFYSHGTCCDAEKAQF